MHLGIAEPERRRRMRLADGRELAWAEWGRPDGSPVLFCTGEGMSGSLGFGAHIVAELGIRLIAVDRPGLGWSDPHPGKTLDSWVDDMREFIDGNELRAVSVAGFSQGAPFALALAAATDLHVQRTALISAQDELAHPPLTPLLHPEVAALVRAVRDDAAGFVRTFEQIATADDMWRLIIAVSSEHDRAVYLDPAFSSRFRGCLHEGFAQGPQGYVRDLVNALSPWPFEPERIAAPVHLWYGAQDASPVHSPDFGAILASRLPKSTRTVDPEEGGSVPWTKARGILSTLISRARP